MRDVDKMVLATAAILTAGLIGAATWITVKIAERELRPPEKPRDPSPDEMFDVEWDAVERSART